MKSKSGKPSTGSATLRVTRRAAAAAFLSAGPVLAQQPAAASTAAPSESPAQLLAAARERLRRNAERLAKIEIPQSAEPAFQFKA